MFKEDSKGSPYAHIFFFHPFLETMIHIPHQNNDSSLKDGIHIKNCFNKIDKMKEISCLIFKINIYKLILLR
jgi:hypothetical protein